RNGAAATGEHMQIWQVGNGPLFAERPSVPREQVEGEVVQGPVRDDAEVALTGRAGVVEALSDWAEQLAGQLLKLLLRRAGNGGMAEWGLPDRRADGLHLTHREGVHQQIVLIGARPDRLGQAPPLRLHHRLAALAGQPDPPHRDFIRVWGSS